MKKSYAGLDKAKEGYFSHYMALRCKILTPVPYMDHIKDQTYLKSFGSFSDKEIDKVGDLNDVLEENDAFFFRPNVVRYILFCLIMGVSRPFKTIYWHNEFSEYIFVDFDRPFYNDALSRKLLDYLNKSPNETIAEELNDIDKIIHCSKTMSLFNKYGFTDKIKYTLDNLFKLREHIYVDCV